MKLGNPPRLDQGQNENSWRISGNTPVRNVSCLDFFILAFQMHFFLSCCGLHVSKPASSTELRTDGASLECRRYGWSVRPRRALWGSGNAPSVVGATSWTGLSWLVRSKVRVAMNVNRAVCRKTWRLVEKPDVSGFAMWFLTNFFLLTTINQDNA